jgi:hypothetical protein
MQEKQQKKHRNQKKNQKHFFHSQNFERERNGDAPGKAPSFSLPAAHNSREFEPPDPPPPHRNRAPFHLHRQIHSHSHYFRHRSHYFRRYHYCCFRRHLFGHPGGTGW